MDLDDIKEWFSEKLTDIKSQNDRIENKMDGVISTNNEIVTKVAILALQTEQNRLDVDNHRLKLSDVVVLRGDVDTLSRLCEEVKEDTKKNSTKIILWSGGIGVLTFVITLSISLYKILTG